MHTIQYGFNQSILQHQLVVPIDGAGPLWQCANQHASNYLHGNSVQCCDYGKCKSSAGKKKEDMSKRECSNSAVGEETSSDDKLRCYTGNEKSLVDLANLSELLTENPDMTDAPDAVLVPAKNEADPNVVVEFDDVRFTILRSPALKDSKVSHSK